MLDVNSSFEGGIIQEEKTHQAKSGKCSELALHVLRNFSHSSLTRAFSRAILTQASTIRHEMSQEE